MKTRSLKPLWITLIVIASLLLLAVVLGVLNAMVGGGGWSIGWQSYRYDEVGFTLGGGTVYEENIKGIEIDWIKGSVEVVVTEDDMYLSISEASAETLDDSAQLRWKVDGEGKLVVKCRRSGYYLGSGMPEKRLTVRIPTGMLETLEDTEIAAVSASITVRGLETDELRLATASGAITLEACTAQNTEITTASGNVSATGSYSDSFELASTSGALDFQTTQCPREIELASVSGDLRITLPADASFRLDYASVSGILTSDFKLRSENGIQICGDGACKLDISTTSGNVSLAQQKE